LSGLEPRPLCFGLVVFVFVVGGSSLFAGLLLLQLVCWFVVFKIKTLTCFVWYTYIFLVLFIINKFLSCALVGCCIVLKATWTRMDLALQVGEEFNLPVDGLIKVAWL